MATVAKYVGRPMKRKEDPRLIQGLAHYVDDIQLANMHYMAVVRSPYAHAKIRSMDISKAKSAPGVVAVITGEDVRGVIGPVPCAAQIPDMKPAVRNVLATDKVRFVGEPVAVIVANDRYAARDAVDLVEIDYEPLTAVVDPEKAIAKGSPKLYDNFADNVAYRWELEGGDVAGAFKKADKVI
jgi:carbon-monoxide dehydrogenase large subunit